MLTQLTIKICVIIKLSTVYFILDKINILVTIYLKIFNRIEANIRIRKILVLSW